MEESLNDEQFEAIFNGQKVREPVFHCASGNRLSRLCINPNCDSSLICHDADCNTCNTKKHLHCSSILLKGITESLN